MPNYIVKFTPVGIPVTLQRHIYITAHDEEDARQIATNRFLEMKLPGLHKITIIRGLEFNVEGSP